MRPSKLSAPTKKEKSDPDKGGPSFKDFSPDCVPVHPRLKDIGKEERKVRRVLQRADRGRDGEGEGEGGISSSSSPHLPKNEEDKYQGKDRMECIDSEFSIDSEKSIKLNFTGMVKEGIFRQY